MAIEEKDRWYPETERVLKQYWKSQLQLERLKAKESALVEGIRILEAELEEGKKIPGFTAKYGIVPGSSRREDEGYTSLMQEYEEQVDKLASEITKKRKNLVVIRIRVCEIEEENAPFQAIVSRLTEEEKKLLEQRYIFRRSNYQIGMVLNCGEWRVRNMRNKIMEQVAEWLGKRQPRKNHAKTAV